MKAIVHDAYGPPEVLSLREIDRPAVGKDDALVRVHAAGLDQGVWHLMAGMPYMVRLMGFGLRASKTPVLGSDVAGTVEAVGRSVTRFAPGDEVFGTGVGTFAVQLAKLFGTEVTAVCSTGNVEQARSLGADRVVDYTKEDFTELGLQHDLMLDIAGSRSFLESRKVLTPEATVVLIGGRMTYRGLGPLPHLGGTILKSRFRSQAVTFFVAKVTTEELTYLADLLEAGTLRPVIDRKYELSEASVALAYLGEGHAKAKVVITA
jgi:NADPH:quinone reductase-like Zn-dependent oxidoreductase